MLTELLKESLLVPAEDRPADTPTLDSNERSAVICPSPPSLLEKFTDMADLLLFDPIHEVDAGAGWSQPVQGQR